MKKFVKVSVKDIREYWKCENKDCEHLDPVMVNPDFYANAGTPICSQCADDLVFDHVEVKK